MKLFKKKERIKLDVSLSVGNWNTDFRFEVTLVHSILLQISVLFEPKKGLSAQRHYCNRWRHKQFQLTGVSFAWLRLVVRSCNCFFNRSRSLEYMATLKNMKKFFRQVNKGNLILIVYLALEVIQFALQLQISKMLFIHNNIFYDIKCCSKVSRTTSREYIMRKLYSVDFAFDVWTYFIWVAIIAASCVFSNIQLKKKWERLSYNMSTSGAGTDPNHYKANWIFWLSHSSINLKTFQFVVWGIQFYKSFTCTVHAYNNT